MTPLNRAQLLTEDDYLAKVERVRRRLFRGMGAEGIRELLRALDVNAEIETLRKELETTGSDTKIKKIAKRLKVLEAFQQVRHQAGLDDHGGAAGAAAGAAPAGAAGRRPLRDLGPERPVPPRHQPQQPPEASAGAEGARHHRAQRKAHAAGSRRLAARQRPPRQGDDRRQQAAAEVARRHDQGQGRPFPPEPAGQARRLLRPLGDRRRTATQAAPVRPAEADGAGTVQAVHLQQARTDGHGHDDQGRQEDGRKPGTRWSGTSWKRSSASTR